MRAVARLGVDAGNAGHHVGQDGRRCRLAGRALVGLLAVGIVVDGHAHQARHLRIGGRRLQHQVVGEHIGDLDALAGQGRLHAVDHRGGLSVALGELRRRQELAEIGTLRVHRRGHKRREVIAIDRLQGDRHFHLLVIGRLAQVNGVGLGEHRPRQHRAKNRARCHDLRVFKSVFDGNHPCSP